VTTNRHHAAGRAILKAIAKGRFGAALLTADVGRKELLENEELDHLEWQLPHDLIPPHKIAEAGFAWPSRPDGMLLINSKGRASKVPVSRETVMKLVEIKYCVDRAPDVQLQEARVQHDALVKLLADGWQCTVELHVILLGTGGTIYSGMASTLKLLGVEGHAYAALAQGLNLLAVEYVDKALNFRWAQLKQRCRESGQVSQTGHKHYHKARKRRKNQ
jgi:hypothetical protein